MSDLSVEDYDSVEELERTIEKVNSSITRLDRETDILLEETRHLLETDHISDDFRSSSEYVENCLEYLGLPSQVRLYAHRELEEPEQAENWALLEETTSMTSEIIDRFNIACNGIWKALGYEEEEIDGKLGDEPGARYFVEARENAPQRLFSNLESYEQGTEFDTISGMHNPGLTLSRYTGDASTRRQKEDLERGKVLRWELRDTKTPDYDGREDFWRERLHWSPGFSRWVDEESLPE